MTTAAPAAQFPWPLLLGGVAGLILAVGVAVGVHLRGGPRRTWRVGARRVAVGVAAAISGASAGMFSGLVWLWVAGMGNPVTCLYSCADGGQFLSNEQFRQIVLMADLARILPAITVIAAALAAALGLSRRGASAGSR